MRRRRGGGQEDEEGEQGRRQKHKSPQLTGRVPATIATNHSTTLRGRHAVSTRRWIARVQAYSGAHLLRLQTPSLLPKGDLLCPPPLPFHRPSRPPRPPLPSFNASISLRFLLFYLLSSLQPSMSLCESRHGRAATEDDGGMLPVTCFPPDVVAPYLSLTLFLSPSLTFSLSHVWSPCCLFTAKSVLDHKCNTSVLGIAKQARDRQRTRGISQTASEDMRRFQSV
eukprot:1036382-Rhodomonas_salina.1